MSQQIYDLEERLVEFSFHVIDVVEALPTTRAANYIAGQLVRCGLAPALLMERRRVPSQETISFTK